MRKYVGVLLFIGMALSASSVYSQSDSVSYLNSKDYWSYTSNLSDDILLAIYRNMANGNLIVYDDKDLQKPISVSRAKEKCEKGWETVSISAGDPFDPYKVVDTSIWNGGIEINQLGKAEISLRDYSIGLWYNESGSQKPVCFVKLSKLLTYISSAEYNFIYDFYDFNKNSSQVKGRIIVVDYESMKIYSSFKFRQCCSRFNLDNLKGKAFHNASFTDNISNDQLKKLLKGTDSGGIFGEPVDSSVGIAYKIDYTVVKLISDRTDSSTGTSYTIETKTKKKIRTIAMGLTSLLYKNDISLPGAPVFFVKNVDAKKILKGNITTYYSPISFLNDAIDYKESTR